MKTGDSVEIQSKHDLNGFQFGILQGSHTPHQTPRFDPFQIKKSAELQHQLKEMSLKYQASERRDVFEICVSHGRFHIHPIVAHTFFEQFVMLNICVYCFDRICCRTCALSIL